MRIRTLPLLVTISIGHRCSKKRTVVVYEICHGDTEQGTLHARIQPVHALAVQYLLGRSQGTSIPLFLLNLRSRRQSDQWVSAILSLGTLSSKVAQPTSMPLTTSPLPLRPRRERHCRFAELRSLGTLVILLARSGTVPAVGSRRAVGSQRWAR